jgi:quinohemoprotein ethanol dehydrogenase
MRIQLLARSTQLSFAMSKCAVALLCCAFLIEPLFAQEVDWAYYGNDVSNSRFQNIDQINSSNISQLKPAWTFHTGVSPNLGMEMTPLVVDGVMYITAGDDEVFALNPTTGKQLWKYTPTDMPPLSTIAFPVNNRGVAYGQGLIFDARIDAKLVALNAKTGAVAWEATVDLPSNEAGMTLAPQYIVTNGGKQPEVLVGIYGDWGARGHLDAYDAATGKLLWRFWTTEPNTWAGDSYLHGGGAIFATPSFDPALNMVYFGTGNATGTANGISIFLGDSRAGANLYTNCAVALDATTGELQWFFQTTHHDLWDSDLGQPTVLFNWNGTTPAIAFTPKSGWTWILDRASGESLFPYQEVAVSTAADAALQKAWPTQPISSIDSLAEHVVEPDSLPAGIAAAPAYATPGATVMARQPGNTGAVNWPPAAFSPRTNFLYSHAYYEPDAWGVSNNLNTPTCEAKGTYEAYCGVIGGLGGLPLAAGAGLPGVNHGVYGAINTVTGKTAWTIPILTSTPHSGMSVAGDLVFFGDSSGLFYAASAKTGEILWVYDASIEANTGGGDASPAIYEVGGVEYVVYPFGGNPATISTLGDAVIAFALPSAVSAAAKKPGVAAAAKAHVR